MLSHGGLSTYQMAFGADPMKPFMWQDTDSDLDFVQNTQMSGKFVQPWNPP